MELIPGDKEIPVIAEASQLQPPKSHTKDVHILSLAFLLVFLAYGATQNLQSTLNTVSLFTLCIFFLGFS